MSYASLRTLLQHSVPRSVRHLGICLVALIVLFGLAPLALAQDNATIDGTVTDSTGAVVPNVTLTLVHNATGLNRQTTTNSVGAYRFGNIGIGSYTLTVLAPGFQKFTKTGIQINVAQTLENNIVLKIGSQQQTVEVAADALQVQTETSEVSTLISGEQVEELASNGRNITQLAALGMGVSSTLSDFGGVNALTSSNSISFNGTRASHNVYLLDGGEQNDRGCGGCFMNLPSQDAIAEFQTLDSNYQPDYGIGSGGTITMVLKSGTQDFHGEAYEFNRNEDYDANHYFTKLAGKARPKFRLNEPGFNVGGPLFIPHVYNQSKKRTFFFWNEEWRKLQQGTSPSTMNTVMSSNFPTLGEDLNYTVPSGGNTPVVPTFDSNDSYNQILKDAGLTAGGSFTKNSDGTYLIPKALIDQNAVREMNSGGIPKPNYGTSQYISSIPQPTDVREDLGRFDHTINSKFQLMGHFLHDAVSQTYYPPLWTSNDYPTVGTAMKNPSYSAAIKLTQTYSPSLLNETSLFYSGNKITLSPVAGTGVTIAQPTGWDATSFFSTSDNVGARMPEIDFSGSPLSTTYTTSYFPWKNGYEGFDYRDDLSWTHGKHQFKFGAGWLHDYKNQQLQANTQGTAAFSSSNYSKDSYVNFMLGMATSFTQLEYLAGKHWVNNNYSFYANDNWHVTPRLSLNIGFRYDGMPHAFERYDQFANFVPAYYDTTLGNPVDATTGTLASSQLTKYGSEYFYLNGIKEANVNGFDRGVVKNDLRSWQPRIGFAWDINGNGKTVVRGGVGTFYERVQGNDVYNAALNPPFAYQPSATGVYFSNPNTSLETGKTSSQSFPSTLTNIKYHYPNPGTATYSLGVQREIAPSIIAVLQYVGSDGWDQNNDRSINTLPLQNAAGNYNDRKAVAAGTAVTNYYRKYPGFSTITQEENTSHTNYNSLQAGIRIERKKGWTVQFAYTWSHEIDNTPSQFDLSTLSNPFNDRYDRASGSMDRRHIFNSSYMYRFPFFANSSNALLHSVLGGWEFSGITVAETGTPQYITYTGSDTVGLGGGTTNRPNLLSKVSYPKKRLEWFSTSSFGDPTAPWDGGTTQGFGNAGRDAVVAPGRLNFNMSLFKTIDLSKKKGGPSMELRFESFNTFNHTQFSGMDASSHDSNFGQITSTYDPRTMQFGGKLRF